MTHRITQRIYLIAMTATLLLATSLAWAACEGIGWSWTAPEAASQAPKMDPANPLKVVSVYSGKWHSDDEAFDTKFSKAEKEATEITNQCWTSGEFYICHQTVTKPSGPVSAMVTYLWNPKEHLFDAYTVDGAGGDPWHGHLTISGDTWTWGGAAEDKSAPTRWRTVNIFSSPNDIVYRVEFSTDGGAHWAVSRQGKEKKTGE